MKNPQICNVKRLILTVLLLALYWRGQAATHVVFDMEAFNASPATNRTVTMQRLQPFRGNLISYATGTNSSVTASNLGIGDYDCVILQRGAASAIPFQVTVTATNLGVIGANTNTSVRGQQSYPVSGTSSWTILASENRYGGGSIPDGSIATNKVDSEFWDFLLSLDGGGTPGDSGMLIPSAGRLTSASNELAATTGIFNAVQASTYSGSGAALTSLNASQLASGTVPEARSAHTMTNVLNYVDNTAVFLNKDTGANLLAFDSSAFLGTDEAWTTDIGIKSTAGFEGPAVGLTTGTPDLATNNGTATDGMVLSKQGNRLALISVGGGGDMIGANSLADIAGLGGSLALARTNLSAHNADNLTRGTVALVRLPSIPASQTTNSAKFSDWNMWTDGSTYYAQNKLLTSTLSSNNFSGLLQTVASSAVTAGLSTRITVASGTDASASVSNRYYWFTNTVILTNGIIIQGAGNAATIFAASPALTGPLIQVGADGNFLGGIARFENIRWHGDAGAASSVGLKFRNVAEPNVFNCEFNSFQLAGIQVNNTNYNHWSQILHCFFVGGGAGSHCVLIDAAPAAITCRLQIRDCDFEPHGGAAVTVSNHFRNLTITGSTFGDSSGTSTAGIRVYAGNGFQFIGNTFTPFWGSTVAPIRFDNRTSATNINADVSHNMANGLTTQSLIWIGTNVQGVSIVGNVNPGGNIVTNASLGNATYVRADREKIYTDGDITAGGTVSGAAASFPIQTNTVLNVGSLVIPNGWDASTATNIPIRALWGSGGTNTAATNGTAGQLWTSAGNGGGYWGSASGQVAGNVFGDRAVWNGSAWEDDSRWIHFEQEFLMSAAIGWPLATFNGGAGGQLSAVDTTTNRIGVQALSAGTTATSYYGECVGGASIRTFTWGQGEEMVTDLTCYIPTLSDDTENYCFQFGYADSQITNAPADNLVIQYSNNTNGGKWQAVSRNSLVSTNVYDLGTNVVANRWYAIRIKTATDGTSAAYLDGVLVQSGIAATSGQVIPLFRINKAAGTTDRTVRLDYYRWSVRRAISRYQ